MFDNPNVNIFLRDPPPREAVWRFITDFYGYDANDLQRLWGRARKFEKMGVEFSRAQSFQPYGLDALPNMEKYFAMKYPDAPKPER